MLLDTNILVRHPTDEPTEQADRATFLGKAEALERPPLIVAVLLCAVELYETARVHFAEADLAVIAARSDGLVASLDRDLDRIDGITRVEP